MSDTEIVFSEAQREMLAQLATLTRVVSVLVETLAAHDKALDELRDDLHDGLTGTIRV